MRFAAALVRLTPDVNGPAKAGHYEPGSSIDGPAKAGPYEPVSSINGQADAGHYLSVEL